EFVSKTASEGKNPVFESPTGSGKTIAVLSSIIPLAREKGKKILYLCRTHEQTDRVIEELKMITTHETVKGLSLRSRKALCLNEFILEKARTIGEERFACSILKREGKCKYYKNFNKSKGIRFGKPMTAAEVAVVCKASGICPYEAAKGLLSGCDVVACSYLYIFEPGIRTAFLKAIGCSLDDVILILDEAHNLPRLAGDIAGERLTEFAVSSAVKEVSDYRIPEAEDFLEGLQSFIVANESEERRLKKDVLREYLSDELEAVHSLEEIGDEVRKRRLAAGKRPISFLHACASFVRYWTECSEEEFAFFASKTTKGRPMLEVLSLDPKSVAKPPLEGAFLSMHMSGTLTPVEPYCEVVGLENFISKSFPSPFPKENIAAFVDPSVTTLGSLRSKEMYGRIARKIKSLVSTIPGNVLVFFPSYVVLNSVLDEGAPVKKEVFIERGDMTSTENNNMIKRFKGSKNAVLFGVQQGRNSEGQDFPGEEANGVIVVGIPYAIKGPKVTAQIEYYKRIYNGWWGRYPLGEYYAYFLPAYRSLNQAAGRAHRKLTDKGAIIFLERRVAFDRKVKANISPWIKENMKGGADIEKEIEEFYR
ncbi:MAG: helicase C-terminal domain-containing protein, partial [Candidatus Hydrothermarchaeales archaeon]